jgi:hypothetical protein
MSGLRPQKPEAVSYREYEQQRDGGLPPVSLDTHKDYTVRIRHYSPPPTQEVFAYDYSSRVMAIEHLGKYSVVRFVLINPGQRIGLEAGISLGGIVFDHTPLPEDLEYIPYSSERGYFVGRLEGVGGKGAVPDEDLQDVEIESTIEQRELVMAR